MATVESVCGYQEVGVLQCIGVVSGCCCKEVYTFYYILTTPLELAHFCSSIPPLFFYNVFTFLFMLFLCNIANIVQRTFEIVQRLRSCGHGDIIISTSMLTTSPKTSTCEVLGDVLRNLQADFVYDNGHRDKLTACLMVKL